MGSARSLRKPPLWWEVRTSSEGAKSLQSRIACSPVTGALENCRRFELLYTAVLTTIDPVDSGRHKWSTHTGSAVRLSCQIPSPKWLPPAMGSMFLADPVGGRFGVPGRECTVTLSALRRRGDIYPKTVREEAQQDRGGGDRPSREEA